MEITYYRDKNNPNLFYRVFGDYVKIEVVDLVNNAILKIDRSCLPLLEVCSEREYQTAFFKVKIKQREKEIPKKESFTLSMEQLGSSKTDSFDCLYTALKKEFERQRQLERDFIKENPNKNMYNINCFVLDNFLKQLEEQDPLMFLGSERVYQLKFSNEQ